MPTVTSLAVREDHCSGKFHRLWNLYRKIAIMSAWRAAGLNYINYSNIAAKMLRRALKQDLRADALKRDASHVRITPWANGKPSSAQQATAK